MKNGDYLLVVAPEDFPGMKYRGRYCYEHHLVYWKKHGVVPKKDELIHHKNENKRDNGDENLELILRSAHAALHARQKAMITLTCKACGKGFERERRQVTYRINAGQIDFYCSLSCCARDYGRGRPKNIPE